MRMPPEVLQLKNGKTCILRSVEPEDAGRMITYMKRMLGETPYLLRTPEEFDYTEYFFYPLRKQQYFIPQAQFSLYRF